MRQTAEAARDASHRTPFPFARAMAFGLGVLRLPSRDFWSMTPRELFRAVEGVYGAAPGAPSRAVIEELMRRFPDSEGPT
ncbi:rcc01693 family protein [Methylocystis sp.]|uniref:rcc01693 family protein n=1 Tax=Methylocystis sp. TaxID=1911079 RepID=UPI002735D108|nr:rcc01693 family protein [Methylocystis sp.]MDP3554885.1 phage tail assembly chaperone [Methylocystis sp.]